jgi:hypothetical protein
MRFLQISSSKSHPEKPSKNRLNRLMQFGHEVVEGHLRSRQSIAVDEVAGDPD